MSEEKKDGLDRFPGLASVIDCQPAFMASIPTKVFSLQGKGLKLDSRSDIEPHLKNVDPTVIEEIHLGGNTVGIGAAEALAEFLKKTTTLKVGGGIFTRFLKDQQN